MSDPEDFSIGWICALATEYVAARAFLDKELPDAEHVAHQDDNEYTLGIMGRHHVVIASLPNGEYGISPATGVVRNMLHTFPNIRFVLMVGIGGGAPTATCPIRLGDVVVSQPSNGHGGVFQYDFGKTIQAQEFQHTGFLNQPPSVLLTATNGLKARHESDGHNIQQSIAEALKRKPRLKKKYGRPPADSDRLYRSEWTHPNAENGTCIDLCGYDGDNIVQREERDPEEDDPRIYYGLIASANSLMKDAVLRDKLANFKGVLCFEMEAAGIMNQFPCLVIRGICDYADTHKNKDWQGYAAMTAAAYAKELLDRVAPPRVQETRRAKEVMKEAIEAISGLRGDVQVIPKLQMLQIVQQKQQIDQSISSENRLFLQALKICDYESFKDRNPHRAPGTCNWVRRHPRYLKWKALSRGDLLWISADPGCGKSVLARAFVDDAEFSFSQPTTKCYFFFKDNDHQNSLAQALCSLLHQLFSQQPKLLKLATGAWQKHGDAIHQDPNELWRIFSNALLRSHTEPVLCVFDALDECRDQDRSKLLGLLKDFYGCIKEKSNEHVNCIKIIATSRPYRDLEQQFGSIPEIRLKGENENETLRTEIDFVIHAKVGRLAQELRMKESVKSKLLQKLLRMKHRTYLWVYLAFDAIEQTFRKSWNLADEDIDVLPSSVHDAYEKMLAKIVQSRDQRARLVLGIVLGARRPLSVRQLAYALGVATTDRPKELEKVVLRMNLKAWIREYCYLFIHFSGDKAHLVHQTAKEFLLQSETIQRPTWSWSFTIGEIEQLMATMCIRALSSNDFVLVSTRRLNTHKSNFLTYCVAFWTSHLRLAYNQVLNECREQIDMLHDPRRERCRNWLTVFQAFHRDYELPENKLQLTQCMLCAFTGHLSWLEEHVEKGSPMLDTFDEEGRDALWWASRGGNRSTVEFLLQQGADVNASNGIYGRALNAAVRGSHTEIVQSLLKSGASPLALDYSEDSALTEASLLGNGEIVQILLDAGASIDSNGHIGNALHAASFSGSVANVHLLLEHGANVNAMGGCFGSALCAAAEQGHFKVVQVLLDRGADVNALVRARNYANALCAASYHDHFDIVRILLDNGADANARGDSFRSALHNASAHGNLEAINLLLDRGAHVNAPGDPLGSALQTTARNGHVEASKLLLRRGADVNASGKLDGNAMHTALAYGKDEVASLLQEHGARQIVNRRVWE